MMMETSEKPPGGARLQAVTKGPRDDLFAARPPLEAKKASSQSWQECARDGKHKDLRK